LVQWQARADFVRLRFSRAADRSAKSGHYQKLVRCRPGARQLARYAQGSAIRALAAELARTRSGTFGIGGKALGGLWLRGEKNWLCRSDPDCRWGAALVRRRG